MGAEKLSRVRNGPAWGHFVDRLRQHLRELFRQLLDGHPGFRRQLLQQIRSKRAV